MNKIFARILKETMILLIIASVFLSTASANILGEPERDKPTLPRLCMDDILQPRYMEESIYSRGASFDPLFSSEIFFENFDGTWVSDPDPDDPYLVPDGWDIDGICTSSNSGYTWATHHWAQYNDSVYPLTHSQPTCAGVWWSDGSGGDPSDGNQDEWLITPELDLTGYSNIHLVFYSCYMMASYPAVPPHYHTYIKISTDGGAFWRLIADLSHDHEFDYSEPHGGPGGDGWNWNEMPPLINLSEYLDGSSSVMVAFNQVDAGLGGGAMWQVDDVHVFSPQPPQADANGPYYGLATGWPIQFYGNVSDGVSPYIWHWDFGDGNTSDEQNPTNQYNVAGNYTVTFTVTDRFGDTANDTTTAVIREFTKIEIGNINGGIGITVVIKNVGDVDVVGVEWNISLDGGLILYGRETSGTITSIHPGEEATVKSEFIFGLGIVEITVTASAPNANTATKTASGFVFGPFVIGVK